MGLADAFKKLDSPSVSTVQTATAPAMQSVAAANVEADSTNASMSFPAGIKVEQPSPKEASAIVKEQPKEDMSTPPAPAAPAAGKTEAGVVEKVTGKSVWLHRRTSSTEDISRTRIDPKQIPYRRTRRPRASSASI